LRDVLDIAFADKLKNEILNVHEEAADSGLALDASKVGRITTPCIQVILSAASSCEKSHIDFRIISPSEVFTKAFADLGLEKDLTNWSR